MSQNNHVILKATNISKSYSTGTESFNAIKNVSLDIYEGDFTIIMGSSGSGKSTLLYLLSGLDNVTSGEIFFKGNRMDGTSEAEIAKFRAEQIGYVYQSMNLVPDLTLLENVSLPGYIANRQKGQVKARTVELLSTLGLEQQLGRLPSQVSGGQQQRAAIARALINSPELLFADEPTGALSQQQGTEILDILTEQNRKGQTIVMVTHDHKAACRADRLLIVSDGQLSQDIRFKKYRQEDFLIREQEVLDLLTNRGEQHESNLAVMSNQSSKK